MTTNYWDLSDRERSELEHGDVERFVDFELMRLGVLKAQAPTLEDVNAPDLPTRTFFVLSSKSTYSNSGIAFETIEQAKAVMAMAPVMVEHRYLDGSTIQYAQPRTALTITAIELASDTDLASAAGLIEKAAAAKKKNEAASKEYADALKKQEDTLSGMWEDWYAQRECAAKHRRVVDTFADYVKTAGGDAQMAATFLRKVFGTSQIEAASSWFGVAIPIHPDVLPMPESEPLSPLDAEVF